MTIEFLPRATVEKKLAQRGAKITTVVFAKKDGTVTRRTGMPKVHKRRVGGEAGARASQALRDHGNVWFDYCDPDGNTEGKKGFSFNLDRVVHI